MMLQAYSVEFDQQWSGPQKESSKITVVTVSKRQQRALPHCLGRSHFDSQMEIFKLKPQKPSSSFAQQAGA